MKNYKDYKILNVDSFKNNDSIVKMLALQKLMYGIL